MEPNYFTPEITLPLRLSIGMIQLLKECWQREIENLPPPDALLPGAAGLIRRKLVFVKPYITIRGKKILGIYTTEPGRDYLRKKEY